MPALCLHAWRMFDASNLPPFGGFAFIGEPLDRADAMRVDDAALAAAWDTACLLLLDDQGRAAANEDGQPFALSPADLGGGPGAAVFLGQSEGRAWFSLEASTVPVSAPRWIDLREAALLWPAQAATAFSHARGMAYWHARCRFCGVCGAALAFTRGGYLARCGQCSTEHYPRVDPAVIMAVECEGHLLLGRQKSWAPRRWSVLAGFVEPGESLEQTVVREAWEETRVRVRAVRYMGSQPWPFPGALMLGFAARAEQDPPEVDGELEDARWFTVAEIGAAIARDAEDDGEGIRLSPPISISRSLIEHWYHRQRG